MVRQRRAPIAVPPFRQVPGVGFAGREDVEGDREGVRVEASTDSLGQAAVKRKGNGGSFRSFPHDESRVQRNGVPPEEKDGQDKEGEEGGPASP